MAERIPQLAIIGKGKWGSNYIKTIQSGEFEFGLPDENIKARDYPDLYAKKDKIAGVIVASPTSTHFAITSDLLTHGFNVLIEKPVTQTYEQSQALTKLYESTTDQVAMAGHIQLYDPAYITLKNNLDMIGDVQEVKYQGLQSPTREDATVLEDWGPHPIYLFLDLASTNPTSMKATKGEADNINLEFDFGNIHAIAEIGWTYPKRRRLLHVSGVNGSLTIDGSNPEKKRLFYTNSSGEETDLEFSQSPSPLANEINEFIDCIKNNKEPKTPLSQGVEVVKIIQDLSATI